MEPELKNKVKECQTVMYDRDMLGRFGRLDGSPLINALNAIPHKS